MAEFHDPFDPDAATVRLSINLKALAANWQTMRDLSGNAECGAAVKADAYGIGIGRAGPALYAAGCRHFFVADANEGAQLRRLLSDARIYVLSGAFPGTMAQLTRYNLTPVLCSQEQIRFWRDQAGETAAALQIDTGMSRMGVTHDEARDIGADISWTPDLVMSHFACADAPKHPLNQLQISQFTGLRGLFPRSRASLANSAGIYLGHSALFDLTRPGIALYGGEAVNDVPNSMQTVVTAHARILMNRTSQAGQTVSYGATHTFARSTRLAICGVGYADGYLRSGSGSGVPLRDSITDGATGAIAGHKIPLIGRVTMDLVMFDVTDLPDDKAVAGDWIELFGPNIALDDAARSAGTIGYELLTSLGQRYARAYSV